MSMLFGVIPIIWRAVRPSRTKDMVAVVNSFWLPKGYEGLTFFGKILTPNQELADQLNHPDNEGNMPFSALKNHEMIHLRQAQSCGDSWIRYYLLYIWYWVKGLCKSRKLRKIAKPTKLPSNIAYLLNPFEMEAYANMYKKDYLAQCEEGARGWRKYAEMPIEERLQLYLKNHKL